MALSRTDAAPVPQAPDSDVPAIRAQSVYRFYRAGDEETLALQGVSIALNAGELVTLAGPSGSGKSTLLACLAGTDEPSGGTVWIGRTRMSGRTESERTQLRARSIGTMAQSGSASGSLFGHLTVLGNLLLARSMVPRRHRSGEDPGSLLEALGIAQRAHWWPDQLSGGERVRASLAVAMVNRPQVLLADEPTGELDAFTGERVLQLLRERAQSGCAVLIASHSPTVIAAADRVLRLHDGKLT